MLQKLLWGGIRRGLSILSGHCRISMMECKGMGMVHSGFYGALFNGDEEQGRLFDDLVGSIRSADEGKAKAIYLTGSHSSTSSACIVQGNALLSAS